MMGPEWREATLAGDGDISDCNGSTREATRKPVF